MIRIVAPCAQRPAFKLNGIKREPVVSHILSDLCFEYIRIDLSYDIRGMK